MGSKERSWWQKARKPLIIVAFIAALAAILALIFLGYRFSETGFQKKTLWDWLQLLIIPVVLAIGGFWLNQIQKSREEKTTEQRAKIEREAAEKRAQTEREIALDNQQEATLQEYINKMSELLLHEKIREPVFEQTFRFQARNEAQHVARARTLTALSRLDANRKRSMIQFLFESDLIDIDKCSVHLKEADLSGADLSRVSLYYSDLSEVNLNKANLSKANLTHADLVGAKLREARLSLGNIVVDPTGAILEDADLCGADLSGAIMNDVILVNANLSGVNLSGADLSGADLTRANLTKATITQEQLNKAKSLKGATMPDGSIHP